MSVGIKPVPIGNGRGESMNAIFPGTSQVLTIASGGSVQLSSAVGSSTKAVRIATSAGCFIAIGASPVATNSTALYLPANTVEVFGCDPGDKVSALDNGAAGKISVTEAVSS